MEEIYVPIKGYEEFYEVSNFGNVRSKERVIKYKDGRTYKYGKKQITKSEKGNGYLFVTLWKNNQSKMFHIHRLVAQHFIENPENKPQVNHIDENKKNNHVSNLEWVTALENMNSGTVQKRNGEKHSKPVKAIFDDGSYKIFRNHLLASAEFGMPDWLIRRASKNGRKINGVIFCRP